MKQILLVIVFFSTLSIPLQHLYGQIDAEDVILNRQFWLDYNMKTSINEKKSISGFVGYRSISPHVFNKLVIMPSYNIIHTKSPEFMKLKKPIINSFHFGAGLYYTQNIESDDNLEFRLMQGFQIFTPEIKGMYLKNFVRLEERFQKTFDDSSLSVGLRMRYRISTVIEWKKRDAIFEKGLYLPMSVEFFFSFKSTDQFNDQIRISPGIGYKFNNNWRCEFSVSYHNTKNTIEDEVNTNDIVFRLRIYKSNITKGLFIRNKENEIKELIE